MAIATILVCDRCGKAAVDTIRFKAPRKGNLDLDLCQRHLDELTAKAHKPRRGRPTNGA